MSFRSKLRSFFRREKIDADMAEEMRAHLELQIERNRAAGMSPDDARYAAQRQFGGVDQLKEIAREQRGTRWIEDTVRDLRLAMRQLIKAPGFTVVAVFTLAVGIGVNASVFAFVRDMLLRPLAMDVRGNLASLYTTRAGPNRDFRPFTYSEFIALREAASIFSDVSAYDFKMAVLGRGTEFKRSLISYVPENYFKVCGIRPTKGRFFTAEEAKPGAGISVVVANHSFWQRMGGRDDFVGSEVLINERSFTVIGVAPQGFGGLHSSIGPEVWLPFGAMAQLHGIDLHDARNTAVSIFGNLQPGLTLESARAQLSILDARLSAVSRGDDPRELVLMRPPHFSLGGARPEEEGFLGVFAGLTMALAVMVLLVACLNLANMLLARGMARRKEIAIRLSMGAARSRVVRQLLAEGFLLALLGGVVGLFLGVWAGEAMLKFAEPAFAGGPFAMTVPPAIDASLVVMAASLGIGATLAFSLVPALRATRINLIEDLKQQPGDFHATERWGRFFSLRHCLVMAQIAVSLMLLFTAGLFVRGAHAAQYRDPGFERGGQIVANVDFSYSNLPKAERARRQAALLEQTRQLPGVTSAALASAVPFNFELPYRSILPAGAPRTQPGGSTGALNAGYTAVSRGYFETMGIPLLRGRDFTAAESGEPGGRQVAIIDEGFAQALFPEADALGRHLLFYGDAAAREIEIIGIVKSPHDGVFEKTRPFRLYRPFAQMGEANTYVHLKFSADAGIYGSQDYLPRTLREIDSSMPLLAVRPLADFIDLNINLLLVKMAAIAFSVFGVVALALALVGVYGVKAYAVSRQTRDIGIRIALGAHPSAVVKLIVRQGVVQIACAVVAGSVLALVAGQVLTTMLYQVNPFDPTLLSGAAALIAGVALIACWLPARRAARVNPMVALRSE
jgi:putative ABC transport system permease protein